MEPSLDNSTCDNLVRLRKWCIIVTNTKLSLTYKRHRLRTLAIVDKKERVWCALRAQVNHDFVGLSVRVISLAGRTEETLETSTDDELVISTIVRVAFGEDGG